MTTRLTGASLFSGMGGLDLAVMWLFHDLGIDLRFAWDCDIKPAAKTFLAHRRPHAPNLGDIHDIATPLVDTPPVDVLTFGWPCQPHSAAGKRLGEADPRALWPEVLRVIRELRPTYLFGENVARVAGNGELRRVVQALAEVGYVGAWRCVRASDIGAPHRRDRLFLLGVRADAAADTISAELRHEPGRSSWADGPGAGVAGDDGPQRTPGAGELTLLPTPAARDHKGVMPRGERKDGYAKSAAQLDLPGAVALLPTPRASDGPNGGPNQRGRRGDLAMPSAAVQMRGRDWGKYVAAVHRWERLTRPAPDPTAPLGRNGEMRLCPKFVEWMMGLPAGWVTDVPGLTRAQQLSMLGDGVVPQQARHAYDLLLADLSATTGRSAA